MKRLTKKVGKLFYTKEEPCYQDKYTMKLGMLEDVEKELGIDLITLYKALKDGVYVRWRNLPDGEILPILRGMKLDVREDTGKGFYDARDFNQKPMDISTGWILVNTFYAFSDYGKTWALTIEELEK